MPIAMVTGAGSGIGRAVSRKLIENGYRVILVGRRKDKLDESAQSHGNKAVVMACDVSNSDAVKVLFERIEAGEGRLDLLFNNAGIAGPSKTIDELDLRDWLEVTAINLHGAFFVARAAFSLMRRQRPQGGRIINNGSVSAQVPRPGSVAYTATKHALTGVTKSLSLDGRPFDIACGQIDVGNAGTDMASQIAQGVRQADGSVRAEPTVDVEHVAEAVAYMARLPLAANVQFMTIMASKMPYIGRG